MAEMTFMRFVLFSMILNTATVHMWGSDGFCDDERVEGPSCLREVIVWAVLFLYKNINNRNNAYPACLSLNMLIVLNVMANWRSRCGHPVVVTFFSDIFIKENKFVASKIRLT